MQSGQIVRPDNHCEGFRVADYLVVGVLLRQRVQSLPAKLALQPEAAVPGGALYGNIVAQISPVHGQPVVADAAISLAVGRAHIREAGQSSAEVKMDRLPFYSAHSGQLLDADAIVEVVEVVGRRDELQRRILWHRTDGQHRRTREGGRSAVATIIEALDDPRFGGVILKTSIWGAKR